MLTVLFKIGRAIGMQCDLADACKVEILPVHLPALTVNSNKRMSGMFFDFKRCGNLVP